MAATDQILPQPLKEVNIHLMHGYENDLKKIFQAIVQSAEISNKRIGGNTFEPHWSYADVQFGLEKGNLSQGIFHVTSNNKDKGVVVQESYILGKEDIHIIGFKNRNRAFEGDKVVVKILNRNMWVDKNKPTGFIVYILEFNHTRGSIGKIESIPNETQKPVVCLGFQSMDPGVPPAAIIQEFETWKKKQDHPSPFSSIFYAQSSFFHEILYYVEINDWLVCNVAKGELVYVVDGCGSRKKNLTSLFSHMMKCLVTKYPFRFEQFDSSKQGKKAMNFYKELLRSGIRHIKIHKGLPRTDLLHQFVFTLGASESVDHLSMGFSSQILENDVFEISVHVSDVAHFLISIKQDENHIKVMKKYMLKLAMKNLISLTHKNDNMSDVLLPPLRKICSISPEDIKIALTFQFKFDKEGSLISSDIVPSLIKSSGHVTYALFRKIITDTNDDESWSSRDKPIGKLNSEPMTDFSRFREKVRQFYSLSESARQHSSKRLYLPEPEMTFSLNGSLPSKVHVNFKMDECDKLIDYWTFQVNKTVAQKLMATFPNRALLVKQQAPDSALFKVLELYLSAHGININTSSPSCLADSWERIQKADPKCDNLVPLLMYYFHKIIKKPEFCCSFRMSETDVCHHYSSDEPYYTEMCSPLHNFTHIMVQKQLHLFLGTVPEESSTITNSAFITQKAESHKRLQEDIDSFHKNSNRMYLAALLAVQKETICCRAIVVEVAETSIEVLVPSLYLTNRIFLDEYNVSTRLECGVWCHRIYWKSPEHTQDVKHFSFVLIKIKKCDYNFNLVTHLCHPNYSKTDAPEQDQTVSTSWFQQNKPTDRKNINSSLDANILSDSDSDSMLLSSTSTSATSSPPRVPLSKVSNSADLPLNTIPHTQSNSSVLPSHMIPLPVPPGTYTTPPNVNPIPVVPGTCPTPRNVNPIPGAPGTYSPLPQMIPLPVGPIPGAPGTYSTLPQMIPLPVGPTAYSLPPHVVAPVTYSTPPVAPTSYFTGPPLNIISPPVAQPSSPSGRYFTSPSSSSVTSKPQPTTIPSVGYPIPTIDSYLTSSTVSSKTASTKSFETESVSSSGRWDRTSPSTSTVTSKPASTKSFETESVLSSGRWDRTSPSSSTVTSKPASTTISSVFQLLIPTIDTYHTSPSCTVTSKTESTKPSETQSVPRSTRWDRTSSSTVTSNQTSTISSGAQSRPTIESYPTSSTSTVTSGRTSTISSGAQPGFDYPPERRFQTKVEKKDDGCVVA